MKKWLDQFANEHEIEILLACEAGSRAWDAATNQSDHDIRLVFRYKDLKKYLSLRKPSSTIEISHPYDINGFDIYKTMELILKSNPSIYEWSYSPSVYLVHHNFGERLRKVIETGYSPFSLFKHYTSLRKRNLKEIASNENFNSKQQKQLILAVRAEMICQGILTTQKVCSPYYYIEQIKDSSLELNEFYHSLIRAKKTGRVLTKQESIEIIRSLENDNISRDVDRLNKDQPNIDMLEKWVWEILFDEGFSRNDCTFKNF
jgi:uncharacterized protein